MASDSNRRQSAIAFFVGITLAAPATWLVINGIGMAFGHVVGNTPTYMVNIGVALYALAVVTFSFSLVQGIRSWRASGRAVWWVVADVLLLLAALAAAGMLLTL